MLCPPHMQLMPNTQHITHKLPPVHAPCHTPLMCRDGQIDSAKVRHKCNMCSVTLLHHSVQGPAATTPQVAGLGVAWQRRCAQIKEHLWRGCGAPLTYRCDTVRERDKESPSLTSLLFHPGRTPMRAVCCSHASPDLPAHHTAWSHLGW